MEQRLLRVAEVIADDGVSISHGQVAFLPKCLATAGSAYSTPSGTRSYHAKSRMSGIGTFRTWRHVRLESAFGGRAEVEFRGRQVRWDPLRHGLCASMPHGDDAQWPTWTGPPRLIFRRLSAIGTAEIEISIRTQNS